MSLPPDGEPHLHTLLQHLGEADTPHGAAAPGLCMTSTFRFDSVAAFTDAYRLDTDRPLYSRIGNPTVALAAEKIAALEHAERTLIFGSGMAGISAGILSSVQAGGHVVYVETAYGPARELIADRLPRYGVTSTSVVGDDPAEIEAAIRPETSLIYLESPSSMVMRLQDLAAVAEIARPRGIRTMIDNTYAGPYLQRPLDLGIDLTAASASKYLGGHSDLVAGTLSGRRELMESVMRWELPLLGGIIHPFGAWQILRALRTLPLRLEAVGRTADEVAGWLKRQPWCGELRHVGDPDFPQAELRDRQMAGTTGLFSFFPAVQEKEAVHRFVEALRYFRLGVRWGGHGSLVVCPQVHQSGE
ncbi:MAG: aminotransferase class V-fold PLP-dependent enzyme, partial [Fimbriimonadaceae bacterium]|nr:aminotransferase class V-fold PLP-dependent enzyme [Fimbriimonadaceae bacterium]